MKSQVREISLSDFVLETSQTKAGEALEMTQGAIWQALRAKREIYVVLNGDRVIDCYQKRQIGKFAAA